MTRLQQLALSERIHELERENADLRRRLDRQADIANTLRRQNNVLRVRRYEARQRAELWKHRALRKDAA